MDVIELLMNRRSHRKYSEIDISDERVKSIIECGLSASFGGPPKPYCQVSEFIIVRDDKVKEALALSYDDRQYIKDAPVVIACCANTKNDPKYKEWVLSASLSIQNLIVAAESYGIGCCVLSCFLNHADHTEDKQHLREVLNIPDSVDLLALVSMGYKVYDEDIPVKKMRDYNEVVSYNTYGN